MSRPRTVVFVHAHPDDEVFLTGGTMARLAAEGHRVVLVTATDGEEGLAVEQLARSATLGRVRRQELVSAARVLGCREVYQLGYADSGLHPGADAGHVFSRLPVDEPAGRIARILTDLQADVVVGYDAAGGYGHPDHVQVHRVTRRAAHLANTRLLEATVNRRALQVLLRLAAPLLPGEPQYRPGSLADRFTHPKDITHVVRVGRHVAAKRTALAEHASQAGGGEELRLAAILLRLPAPAFSVLLGREWFVEPGRRPARVRTEHQFFETQPGSAAQHPRSGQL